MFEFSLDPAQVIQLVLTVILPILVGLVTTRTTRAAVKAWLLAGLSLATSVIAEMGQAVGAGNNFDIGVALLAAIPTFAISVAMYYGLWKPTGVGEVAQDVKATTLVR